MPKSEYDEIEPTDQTEIDRVILAAHALELDSPIIQYRIVGSRIELWTAHGGPYTYEPEPAAKTAPAKPPASKSKKQK